MAARSYDSESRRRQQAERKARIAAATAALHAKKGANDTSYAEIAAEARVSLPTVYAHFPTQRELLEGCTGHVAATSAARCPSTGYSRPPPCPPLRSLLVDALVEQHLHFEPWLAWREDRVIPFLRRNVRGASRDELAALIARVLKRHLEPGDHRETVAGWESVLSFDFWYRLLPRSPPVAPCRAARDRCEASTRSPARRTHPHPKRVQGENDDIICRCVDRRDCPGHLSHQCRSARPHARRLLVQPIPRGRRQAPPVSHRSEKALPRDPAADRDGAACVEASLHCVLARGGGRVRRPRRLSVGRSGVASRLQRGCGDGVRQ